MPALCLQELLRKDSNSLLSLTKRQTPHHYSASTIVKPTALSGSNSRLHQCLASRFTNSSALSTTVNSFLIIFRYSGQVSNSQRFLKKLVDGTLRQTKRRKYGKTWRKKSQQSLSFIRTGQSCFWITHELLTALLHFTTTSARTRVT